MTEVIQGLAQPILFTMGSLIIMERIFFAFGRFVRTVREEISRHE